MTPLPKNQRMTDKQLKYLKYLLSPEELHFIKPAHLSKHDADFLIKARNGTF